MFSFVLLANTVIVLEGLPVLVVILRKSRKPAHLWIASGFALTFLADLAGTWMAYHQTHNQWLGFLVAPPIIAMFLLGLGSWQLSYVERIALKVTSLLTLVTLSTLTLTVENLAGFSRFTGPLGGLILLVAALWTMLRRSFGPAIEAHTRTDWFWVSLGLALYAISSGAYEPVAAALMDERIDLVYLVLKVRMVIYILGFLSITWGLLRPWPMRHSGLSSSLQHSA